MATRKVSGVEAAGNGQQTIEELQQRYDQLNKQKIQCETKLDEARKQLNSLKREAREKYGTDDLAELASKLEQMKAENEDKRAKYQTQLDKIENDLSQVEQTFQTVESQAAKG